MLMYCTVTKRNEDKYTIFLFQTGPSVYFCSLKKKKKKRRVSASTAHSSSVLILRRFHLTLKHAFQATPCKWNPQQLIIDVVFDTESSVALPSRWGPRWASRASMTSCPRASTSSASRGTATGCRSGRSRGWSSRFWRPTSPGGNLRNSPSSGPPSRSASVSSCVLSASALASYNQVVPLQKKRNPFTGVNCPFKLLVTNTML